MKLTERMYRQKIQDEEWDILYNALLRRLEWAWIDSCAQVRGKRRVRDINSFTARQWRIIGGYAGERLRKSLRDLIE